ncbi:MAG: hypothetical protein HYV92_13615 [Candidatus Rokubacteria bacterium]|nr:hypothetical protein [Candidatus Rokubacteria bacterium]MBI2555423.1 hypothetical protein [Candidatus Rokubacteria bacterium]
MNSHSPRAVGLLALLLLSLSVTPLAAQWLSPQSDKDLRLTWNSERTGPSRVLILGDVQNLSRLPASRVVLKAEGLDEAGKVVSRARGYVSREIPAQGSSNFEIRLAPSGSERQYRVTVESFEFVDPVRGGGGQSP